MTRHWLPRFILSFVILLKEKVFFLRDRYNVIDSLLDSFQEMDVL
jgi:hypothetical protein